MARVLAGFSLVIALWVASNQTQAHANPPFQFNLTFRFDVETNDSAMYKNLAPWYTYFPYDPYAQTRSTPSFPSWPTTWPPAGATKEPATPSAYRPAGGTQPVSYQYAVPSYWYGR